MKIRIIIFLVFAFIAQMGLCNDYSYAFLVEFSDKENSVYSTDRPLEFLSQRAIDRRLKYGIEIIEQDLPVNINYIDSVKSMGGVFHVASKWMNSAVFYTNDFEFDTKVKVFPFVTDVTKVYGYPELKSTAVNNKFGTIEQNQAIQDTDYGASENQIKMCNAHLLHNNGYFGEGMHIAVLDAGFIKADELACFDSLRSNNLILGTYDFVRGDSNVYLSHTHGTNVLSILASNIPGEIYGSAPHASYWLLRTEDGDSEFRIEEENWIAGAEFADSAGVDLISTSLGYSSFDDPEMNYTYADMDGETTRITRGSEIAFTKGMVLVNSAGNEGLDKITAPADGANTLCIGAVDSEGIITSFSSRGPSYDGRVKPDVSGQGGGTTVINAYTGEVTSGSGTSYSCPLLAGMIACLWQANPSLSNAEIIDVVRRSGNIYDNPDDETGYGIPDFSIADFLAKEYLKVDSSPESLMQVYPNPFNSEIGIDFIAQESEQITIELYDMSGKMIYSKVKEVENHAFNRIYIQDIANLTAGVYILTLKSESTTYQTELIKE